MSDEFVKEKAADYFREAYALQMQGELERAVTAYKRSLECYPTAEAYTFLGWTYSFMGQLDEAIKECLKAIKVDPDFGNPYNDIGAYLIEKGDIDEAIPWFKKAMKAKRYEASCFPHLNLGRVYEMKYDFTQAMRCYRKALEENPDYTLAQQAILRLQAMMN